MNDEPRPPAVPRPTLSTPPAPHPDPPPTGRRMFLREPGWSVALKVGSERTFCYMMAPGQDYYHRLLDGEIFIEHGDERLCLACAERRGLLSFQAKGLRDPVIVQEVNVREGGSAFNLKSREA